MTKYVNDGEEKLTPTEEATPEESGGDLSINVGEEVGTDEALA